MADLMRSPPEAGVVALLRQLRAHVCHDVRGDFRQVLPVYEQLLSPREDEAPSVQHELLAIRAKILACGEHADVVNVVDRMDEVVESCVSFEDQQQSGEAAVPVEEMMRLLVALAGGGDGETFVLEDPMQANKTSSRAVSATGKKRVGDRIHMDDVELVQHSRALFQKPPARLEEKNLFSQNLFSTFGNGISTQHTSLWCADTCGAEDEGGFLTMMPSRQPNQFFSIFPGSPPADKGLDHSLMDLYGIQKQQHDYASIVNVRTLKTMKPEEHAKRLSPSKEVFFYDGTQEVHCGEQMQQPGWGEASSTTENSSWDSESSLDITEPWIARAYAWEDLGDRVGLPEGYCRPPVRGEKRSLHDLVIPDEFACSNCKEETPLEIYEADLIEDSLRALSGVDSTLFRRDFQSATFQLPQTRSLKLSNTTVSVTTSVLEVFRKAGTTLMRLELLAIYYSQVPARGGKTLQAMGDALVQYLSTHRSLVENITEQCLVSSSGEPNQESEVISVTKLVSKTRNLCRVLEILGRVFGCGDDSDAFWPLLQQGEFPRGVALLDHLHHHVSSLRVEDATGSIQDLVTWFLVKSSSPLLAVLSDLISSGRVDEATDPFDEFEVTRWSRNLLEKAGGGGGDGLFSNQFSNEATEMLPTFLLEVAPLIVHLSQVQALLRSVNAIASTHPLVNMRPLVMVTRGNEAVELAEEWQSVISDAVAFSEDIQQPDCIENKKGVLEEAIGSAREVPTVDLTREQAEAKRSSQLLLRDLLDQQVRDRQQRNRQLAQEEEADDLLRLAETKKAQENKEAYGRERLLDKYSVLMADAEERHDYMKWRRDRAVRLPTARKQLLQLHANDKSEWEAVLDQEKRRNEATTCENGALATSASSEENLPIPAAGIPSDYTSTSAWRASVKVNKEAGSRTSSSTESGWKNSVRVNQEAGNRSSASDSDGIWRASVKVNTKAGNRSSASDSDGLWRASVKVNREAGNRSTGVLNDSGSKATPAKTGVRILNEPGGSGADMYGTLYGNHEVHPRPEESPQAEVGGDFTDDVEMADITGAADQDESEAEKDEDIEMQDATQDEENSSTCSSNQEEDTVPEEPMQLETSGGAGVGAEPMKSTRIPLPPVHPFFSGPIADEDLEVLRHALSVTPSTWETRDFTSLASIIVCCVELPVRLIAQKLEQVAVDWFRNSLRVVEHLRWLRKLMLMSEGLCMDIFARDFLLGLNSTTRVNWGAEDRLSSALTLAMIEASVETDAIAQRFQYRTTAALSQVLDSLTMTPAVPSLLSEIELVYDVEWPLGLVITSQLLGHYKQMHHFLLHVRLTSSEMREVWAMMRTIRRRGQLSSKLERLCGGIVYKMQAFLRAFNEAFATKVLMEAWSELELATQKATTLVELRRCHEEYVAVAIHCCFLDAPVSTIHSAFLDTLNAFWNLSGFVRGLERQVTGRTSEETRIVELCEGFDVALRALVGRLHRVTRDAERSTREFSECFLLRLNFNQFYSTEDVPAASGERVTGAGAEGAVAAEF